MAAPELQIEDDDDVRTIAIKNGRVERLKAALAALSALPESVSYTASTEGAYLFVMARLSSVLSTTNTVNFDLCGEVEITEDEKGSTSSKRVSHSATLKRPTSRAQCESLLSMSTKPLAVHLNVWIV